MKQTAAESQWDAVLETLPNEEVTVDKKVRKPKRPRYDLSELTRVAWLVCEYREVLKSATRRRGQSPAMLVKSQTQGRCNKPTIHDYTRSEEWVIDTALAPVFDKSDQPAGDGLKRQTILKHYYRCRECGCTRSWGYEIIDNRNQEEDPTND